MFSKNNLEQPRITKMIMHAEYLIYTTKHFQVKKRQKFKTLPFLIKMNKTLQNKYSLIRKYRNNTQINVIDQF